MDDLDDVYEYACDTENAQDGFFLVFGCLFWEFGFLDGGVLGCLAYSGMVLYFLEKYPCLTTPVR